MTNLLSKWILKLLGWKITGRYPREYKKFIIVVAPHTSNWDFPLGLLVRGALKADIKYIGKKSLFRFPFGPLFRWLGGYPVDRSKRTNFVDAVVDLFNQKEEFVITITPEGTRKKAEKLRTGFLYISNGAKVPLVLVKFDYGNKAVDVGEPYFPGTDVEKEIAYIRDYFKGVRGKNPEQGMG